MSGQRMQRFTQEARAASALSHPNIIVIHEIGEEAGAHFIASEYVRGTTLRERMARGPVPLGEVLLAGMQVASALSAAHEAGIVHRDVKPENVMVRPDGLVKVLDFGLAKLAEKRRGGGADSSTIATLQSTVISNIFVAPLEDPAGARQITPGVGGRVPAFGMSWAADGRLVYATGQVSSTDVWIMSADGTGNRQLTSNPGRDGSPDVSPDGRHIVFDSARSGRLNIWRKDLDGGGLKQLTDGGRDTSPRFSPDGRWVIYASVATAELRKVPADGGESVRLTDRPVLSAAVSPADGRIAGLFRGDDSLPWRLGVFPPEGGAPARSFDLPRGVLNGDVRWTPDGRTIVYLLERARSSSLWSQSLDGGEPKQLADFSPEQVFSFAFSRDGRQLAFSRGMVIRDVVLISDTKQ